MHSVAITTSLCLPLGGSAYAKLSRPLGSGALALSLHLYDARWNPTEQIPDRIVGFIGIDNFKEVGVPLSPEQHMQVALGTAQRGRDLVDA